MVAPVIWHGALFTELRVSKGFTSTEGPVELAVQLFCFLLWDASSHPFTFSAGTPTEVER